MSTYARGRRDADLSDPSASPMYFVEKSAARRNNANGALFPKEAVDRPFAEGTFRNVALGAYKDCPRKGELTVGMVQVPGNDGKVVL